MTKTANSLAGYIALLRQLALLCKVGSAIARLQYIKLCKYKHLHRFATRTPEGKYKNVKKNVKI